jgi:hypothetical protein
MNLYLNHDGHHYPNHIPATRPSQESLAWEPLDIVNVISAACAAAFMLYLPIRISQLRLSRTKDVLRWQGPSEVVSNDPPYPLYHDIQC